MRARDAPRDGANVAPVDRHAAVQERRPRRRRDVVQAAANAPLRSLVAEAQTRVAPAPRLAMQRLDRGPEPGLVRGERLRTVRFRFGWGPPARNTRGRRRRPPRLRREERLAVRPPSAVEDERPERERVRRRLGLREGERPQGVRFGEGPRGVRFGEGPPASIPPPPPPSLAPRPLARPAQRVQFLRGDQRARRRVGVALVRAGHLARRGDGRARQRRDALRRKPRDVGRKAFEASTTPGRRIRSVSLSSSRGISAPRGKTPGRELVRARRRDAKDAPRVRLVRRRAAPRRRDRAPRGENLRGDGPRSVGRRV